MRSLHPPTAALLSALLLAPVACSDGEPLGPGADPQVSLSVAGAPAGFAGASAQGIVISRTDELRITRVQIVLREIELERQFDDCSDTPGIDVDSCEEFAAGPAVVDLPLDGRSTVEVTISPDPDTYDELEFEIHKPDDDTPEDRDFLSRYPAFDGVSIRVEGSWNGEPFVFTQDLDAEQERALSPPLVVSEDSSPLTVGLLLDVTTWFVRADGSLVDPRSALKGGENEELVEENIEASIELFDD